MIRPPRALWVPFELGRPLGVPENPAFQRRVLLATLELLKASQGPILRDFIEEPPEDGIGQDADPTGWSCPVNFKKQKQKETGLESLRSDFMHEVTALRPWYDLHLREHNRTAVVTFDPDTSSRLLSDFALGEKSFLSASGLPLATELRLAAQDLKAFYFEAATARPDWASPSSEAFNRWFWEETSAGRILKAVKESCLKNDDDDIKMVGMKFLIAHGYG